MCLIYITGEWYCGKDIKAILKMVQYFSTKGFRIFFRMHKMAIISRISWKNIDVEVIDDIDVLIAYTSG